MLGCFCLLFLDFKFDRNAQIEIRILEQLDWTLVGGPDLRGYQN